MKHHISNYLVVKHARRIPKAVNTLQTGSSRGKGVFLVNWN